MTDGGAGDAGWPGRARMTRGRTTIGDPPTQRGSTVVSTVDEREASEFGLDAHGDIRAPATDRSQELCDAILNGVMTLDQLEARLLETAVDKSQGNLSSAARMLGITRPQLAYRLRRLNDDSSAPNGPARGAASQDPP